MPVVDELVTILGLEEGAQNASVARKFTGLLDGIQKKALVLAASVTTSAGALAYFVRDAVGQADELQKLTEVTGIAAETFQEWGYAAAKMGADARSVQSDIAALNKSMSSPIPGQFNMNLAMLGVHGKNAAEVLEQLSDKFQGMTAQRASQWGSMIGLSDDTVRLLREGRATINDLRSEAHTMGVVISDEDIARASEFSRTLKALGYTFNSLRQQIFIGAVPALDRFVAKVRDFLALNMGRIKDWFADFISGFTAALEQVWKDLEPLRNMFTSVTDVITDFLGTGDAAETWGHLIVGAFEGALILLSPLIAKLALVGAAFTAVSIAVEDLFAYFTGSEKVTLTGMLVDEFRKAFPELASAFDRIKGIFDEFWEYFTSPEGLQQLSAFWDAVKTIIGAAVKVVTIPLKALGAVFDEILKQLPEFDSSTLAETFGSWGEAAQSVADAIEQLVNWFASLYEEYYKLLGSKLGKIISGASDIAGGLLDKGKAAFGYVFGDESAQGNVEAVSNRADEKFAQGAATISEAASSFWDGLQEIGGKVADGVVDGFLQLKQSANDLANDPSFYGVTTNGMAQVTVPAPASVYGGTYNTTNNYNVASTTPVAAAQEIMRMQSSRDNLIEAQANGQFAAGVQ